MQITKYELKLNWPWHKSNQKKKNKKNKIATEIPFKTCPLKARNNCSSPDAKQKMQNEEEDCNSEV